MKTICVIALSLLSFFVIAPITSAQAKSHSVNLSWTDTANPAGTTYNVYRATGLCSGTPVFSKLATGVPIATVAAPYVDSTVTPGNFCYQVTATVAGLESPASNSVNPSVLPFPVALSFTVT